VKVFVNGQSREVSTDAALADVLHLGTDGRPARGIAVALDGSVVPRAQVNQTRLHEGARVEIVTAVQGG
jgi:sulfur carrier protein